jgi:hypothetical protein
MISGRSDAAGSLLFISTTYLEPVFAGEGAVEAPAIGGMHEHSEERGIMAGYSSSVLLLEDRRLVSRVLRHVSEGAMGRRLPRLEDIDPWLVGDDWAHCALVRVMEPRDQSLLIAVGDRLLPERGQVLDREPIARCSGTTLLGAVLSFLAKAVDGRSLLMVEGTARHLGAPVLYRALLVPLSADGCDIDAALVATNYRLAAPGEDTAPSTRFIWSHGFGARER